jgi:hypothetical protein
MYAKSNLPLFRVIGTFEQYYTHQQSWYEMTETPTDNTSAVGADEWVGLIMLFRKSIAWVHGMPYTHEKTVKWLHYIMYPSYSLNYFMQMWMTYVLRQSLRKYDHKNTRTIAVLVLPKVRSVVYYNNRMPICATCIKLWPLISWLYTYMLSKSLSWTVCTSKSCHES